jgi:hypothetical protein
VPRLPRLPILLSAAFVLALALRLWLTFDALPDVMASHFDATGQPNGFQPKRAFAWFALGVALGDLALFTALPLLLNKLPVRMINLPHRAYWLAPERQRQSLARLTEQLDWFACGKPPTGGMSARRASVGILSACPMRTAKAR